jgi:hypothetical protein
LGHHAGRPALWALYQSGYADGLGWKQPRIVGAFSVARLGRIWACDPPMIETLQIQKKSECERDYFA